MNWITVNNVALDKDKVLYVQYDDKDSRIVYVRYLDGYVMTFIGDEAIEIWRAFSDEKTYRDEN